MVKLAPVPDDGVPVPVQENAYGLVPPDPVAVKVTAVPAVPVVGPLIAIARVRGLIVMVAVAVAVLAFMSVIVTLTVKVPLALYIVVKVAPVLDAGLPDVAVHANEYGAVPADPVAVNVTAVPTVPVVGPLMATASASGLIAMVAELEAVLALASVIVTDTVNDPFVL